MEFLSTIAWQSNNNANNYKEKAEEACRSPFHDPWVDTPMDTTKEWEKFSIEELTGNWKTLLIAKMHKGLIKNTPPSLAGFS
jgi:hypothetical protein